MWYYVVGHIGEFSAKPWNQAGCIDNLFNALLVLVVVQVVTISSEFLAELRQLLLTPSNFLAGHCIAWRAISRVWAKGMHGCQGNKQWHVQACASSSLKIGGMGGKKLVWYSMKLLHAYCCSVPLGFFCFIHACPFICPCMPMHLHAEPCMSMHTHMWSSCMLHEGHFFLPAGKPVHPRKVSVPWMRMQCPNGGSCSMSSQAKISHATGDWVAVIHWPKLVLFKGVRVPRLFISDQLSTITCMHVALNTLKSEWTF